LEKIGRKSDILFFFSVTNTNFEKLRGAHAMIVLCGSGKNVFEAQKKLYKK